MSCILHLHIGTHKTGTTSLQQMLSAAADDLARVGVLYPKAGRHGDQLAHRTGHHRLGWHLAGKRGETDQCWKDLQQELEGWSGRAAIISSEQLSTLGPEAVQRVGKYLSDVETRLIVYLRRPLSFLLSAYTQRIKMGTYCGSPERFLSEFWGRADYGELLRRWSSVFGVENCEVRLFDKARENGGVEHDFCAALELSQDEMKAFVSSPANVAPSPRQVDMMQRINWLTWWAGETSRRRGWPARLRRQVRRPGLRGKAVRALAGLAPPDRTTSAQHQTFLREVLGDRHEEFLRNWIPAEDRHWIEI